MYPPVLLMSKLLFLVLLFEEFLHKIQDPFLPFIPILDEFSRWPGVFDVVLTVLFLLAGTLLLFNIFPRSSSAVLGLVVILTLLASKPAFRNHVFIVGCLLLLAGLSRAGGRPVLLWVQLSLVYFGAGLDKLVQMDWYTGRFMHTFLGEARENPFYLFAAEMLPDMWLAAVLSWVSIAVEMILAALFLFRRTHALAVWIALWFHGTMFMLLIGETFGHFVEDLLIAYLVFLVWPERGTRVLPQRLSATTAASVIRIFDWDRMFAMRDAPQRGESIVLDRAGWGYVLRHTAGFYFAIFFLYQGVNAYVPAPIHLVVITICAAVVVVLMLPRINRPAAAGTARRRDKYA